MKGPSDRRVSGTLHEQILDRTCCFPGKCTQLLNVVFRYLVSSQCPWGRSSNRGRSILVGVIMQNSNVCGSREVLFSSERVSFTCPKDK